MQVRKTGLQGVLLIKPRRFADERGHFVETYNRRILEAAGIEADFVQDNQSFSACRGTIRGLHFQYPPYPQAKLIRVVQGSVFDVAVDLRNGSLTYGTWVAETLTADGGEQLFVPRGFAHGFCTLEPDTEVAYKVDGYYSPEYDSGFTWNDPDLNIPWPVKGEPILSEKDRAFPPFSLFQSPFAYGAGDA